MITSHLDFWAHFYRETRLARVVGVYPMAVAKRIDRAYYKPNSREELRRLYNEAHGIMSERIEGDFDSKVRKFSKQLRRPSKRKDQKDDQTVSAERIVGELLDGEGRVEDAQRFDGQTIQSG